MSSITCSFKASYFSRIYTLNGWINTNIEGFLLTTSLKYFPFDEEDTPWLMVLTTPLNNIKNKVGNIKNKVGRIFSNAINRKKKSSHIP